MPEELLTFVETGTFTRRLQALGLEGTLEPLQAALLANPEAGDVEPGTGGLRKIRLADPSRGRASEAERGHTISGSRTGPGFISSACTRRTKRPH